MGETKTTQTFWQRIGLNTGILIGAAVLLVLIWAAFERFSQPRIDPRRDENPLGLMGNRVQVEIRNATEVKGLATRLRQYLMDRGFDVVESGNAEKADQAYTLVQNRANVPRYAEMIAALMEVPDNRVQDQVNPNAYVDVTIIIGKDYPTLKPFK